MVIRGIRDAGDARVVSQVRVDNRGDPLTRLASADESASSRHPLPQGGEGIRSSQRRQILAGQHTRASWCRAACFTVERSCP
jgi:hypothetical protein